LNFYWKEGPGLIFRNPLFLISIVLLVIGLQIVASYFSFNFFMKGDLLLGLFFFLFVPALGMGIAYCVLRFRRPKSGL